MDPVRIRELLEPFLFPRPLSFRKTAGGEESGVVSTAPLSPLQLKNISMYIDLLLRWNAGMNLTGVRQPEQIVTRHFGESLFAARHLFPIASGSPRLIDVGSGAGFPGLPIKIWAPQIHLELIESNQKKATFLREAVRTLALTNVNVFSSRAEDFTSTAEVVTLRAVERFAQILPIAARLVAPKGCLALLIGKPQVDPARDLSPTLLWDAPIQIPLATSTVLFIGRRNPS